MSICPTEISSGASQRGSQCLALPCPGPRIASLQAVATRSSSLSMSILSPTHTLSKADTSIGVGAFDVTPRHRVYRTTLCSTAAAQGPGKPAALRCLAPLPGPPPEGAARRMRSCCPRWTSTRTFRPRRDPRAKQGACGWSQQRSAGTWPRPHGTRTT